MGDVGPLVRESGQLSRLRTLAVQMYTCLYPLFTHTHPLRTEVRPSSFLTQHRSIIAPPSLILQELFICQKLHLTLHPLSLSSLSSCRSSLSRTLPQHSFT